MMVFLSDISIGIDPILRIPLVHRLNSCGRNIPTKAKIFPLNEN